MAKYTKQTYCICADVTNCQKNVKKELQNVKHYSTITISTENKRSVNKKGIKKMMNNELKKLIENKLAMIDLTNKAHEGKSNGGKFMNELYGIKQALQALGITITFSINPYFFEDGEASTYTVE